MTKSSRVNLISFKKLVLGKFATSDHNLLHWSMDIMVNCKQKEKAILDFNKANFDAIKFEINATDWDLELHGSAIDIFVRSILRIS